jgi:hypothetical protein
VFKNGYTPWDVGHFYFLGPASQQQKYNTKDISGSPWPSSLPLMTTHFILILNFLIKKSKHQKIQEHVPREWDVGHFFLGAALHKKPKTNDILHPPWQLPLPHMTTHFISILNILIKKSNHQKNQEHAPSKWDVGLGKHLQYCSIVPPPTH